MVKKLLVKAISYYSCNNKDYEKFELQWLF